MKKMLVLVLLLLCLGGLLLTIGCSQQKTGEYALTGDDLVNLAQSGNVEGQIRGRLGGSVEFGLKEAAYMDTNDSSADFDLTFKFAKPVGSDNATPRIE